MRPEAGVSGALTSIAILILVGMACSVGTTVLAATTTNYIPESGTRLSIEKKRVNIEPDGKADKWIRVCREKRECSPSDDDFRPKSTFRA
jgi:hypothetical protein